ncbi:MAG: leucyl aminopeptidase [Dehalococcoidia bacterium]|nr:leucyl aminopeptidase [Dehalococcoidia bacterium]
MIIDVKAGDITRARTGAIVLGYFQGKGLTGKLAKVDAALNKTISRLVKEGQLTGKNGEVIVLHSLGVLPAGMVALMGLGKEAEITADKVRGAVGEACRALRQRRAGTVALSADVGLKAEEVAQAMAEGAIMGLYTFDRYRSTQPERSEIEKVTLYSAAGELSALKRGLAVGQTIAKAVNLTRDMVNEPSNYMRPRDMVVAAEGMALRDGLKLEVLEREDMAKLGMGALLGVAQGSEEPPKFLVLTYRGRRGRGIDLALVGKAITFDSGGISLKPSDGMGEMKGDMAGGAAVLAALDAIAQLGIKINAVAVVAATENLPSGHAYKPGDVLKAMNGKTIEVISTDAEGRLALADALSYVGSRIKPRQAVDVATLTGACVVALGKVAAAVFSSDQALADRILAAASRAGERVWQLPLFDEYKEQNKSEVADIKNTGGRGGAGAITAAQFLSEFAGEMSWAHLDIAGVNDTDKERRYYVKGATGIPVRTLVNLAYDLAK